MKQWVGFVAFVSMDEITAQRFIELTSVWLEGESHSPRQSQPELYSHWAQLAPSASLMAAREQTVADTSPHLHMKRRHILQGVKYTFSTQVVLITHSHTLPL